MTLPHQPSHTEYSWPTAFSSVGAVGYTVQTHLAVELQALYDVTTNAFVWFSLDFNPQSVDHSSRPLRIYDDLKVAVELGSMNDLKIRSLKASLQRAADQRISNRRKAGAVKAAIARADVGWFRPVVAKLDLDGIDLDWCRQQAVRRGAAPGQRDEYLHPSLPADRMAIIIE